MPIFNEWDNPPNGTAPEDAYIPPGNTLEEQVTFCKLQLHDPVVGSHCLAWLREKGLIQ